MSNLKTKALETVYALYNADRMSRDEYLAVCGGLDEIETLRDRDAELENLWDEFGDVPMDPETECMEDAFLDFPEGTNREEIWHWFDERHSKGAAYLLNGTVINKDRLEKLMRLEDMSIECESITCAFNRKGWCRFSLVTEKLPEITEKDGCRDYMFGRRH